MAIIKPERKYKVLLLCGDCGHQLNDTKELTGEVLRADWGMLVMTSGFNAGKCPKGCRATFSDLNINTKMKIKDLESDEIFDTNSKNLFE